MDRLLMFLRSTGARARELLQRRRLAREIDDEMRFHVECETEQNVARGMAPEEAKRQALIAFGGMTRFREETRDARGFAAAQATLRDARLAVRRLGHAPAFTAGVIGTLAIALAAATGIGTLVYHVMLKPLPFPDPDRLVSLAVHTPGIDVTTTQHSAGTYLYLAESARSYSGLGFYFFNEGVTITEGEPERVTGAIVSTNLLGLLGVTSEAGRLFVSGDAVPNESGSGVIISHALWQRRFNGDPQIAGKTIELNRRRRPIIGVLSPSAESPWNSVSILYPETVTTSSAGLNSRDLFVIGRLAPGATIESAARELDMLGSRLHFRYPKLSADEVRRSGFRMTVQSLREAAIAPVRAELRLLSVMVGALLLIAIANVATLALLRAERLRGEIAVSRALGAPRAAVVRRFVIEALLLALGGACLALPLASGALALRFGFASGQIPRLESGAITPAIIGVLALAAIAIGVVLGVASAMRASGGVLLGAMREHGRSTGGRQWRRVQATLVTMQVAVALTLLVGAGLMAASFVRLRNVDLGFTPAERSTFTLRLPFNGYSTWPAVAAFHTRLEGSLRALPGVTGGAIAMRLPSTPDLLGMNPRLDATLRDGNTRQSFVTLNVVSPSYFGAVEIPIKVGRGFQDGDLMSGVPGVVLSESLARALFGSEDAIGREVKLASGGRFPPYRVVGVSGDVYGDRIADGPLKTLYLPLVPQIADSLQMPVVPAGVSFIVRSAQPLSALSPGFRSAVASLDARVPVWGVRTLDSIVAESTARTRLTMALLGAGALATLLLSVVGLYSVIAYAVTARGREFAVRVALGATPGAVRALVLRGGALVTGIGLAVGIALSYGSTRLLRSVLYETSATDVRLYVAGMLVVSLATGIAVLVPARRAARADPMGVLRAE